MYAACSLQTWAKKLEWILDTAAHTCLSNKRIKKPRDFNLSATGYIGYLGIIANNLLFMLVFHKIQICHMVVSTYPKKSVKEPISSNQTNSTKHDFDYIWPHKKFKRFIEYHKINLPIWQTFLQDNIEIQSFLKSN